MKTTALSASVLALAALGGPALRAGVSVGSPAPAVSPSEWLNGKGAVSWSSLKGRLILIEKWATW
jgi:hypothetical protein